MLLIPHEQKRLLKEVFQSDSPEEFVASLPAQSLYLTVKLNGIESCTDLLAIATPEQLQVMIDFDLWQRDRLDEDSLWRWLSVTSEDDSLDLLGRIVRSSDLKLVSLLLGKYTTITIQEEPTDQPPSAQAYTPDKGYTWVEINLSDSDRHFLMGRLLALLFDFDPAVFYQLVGVSQGTTPSDLEERAYQDKVKRLSAEGIPDDEWSLELHAPLAQGALVRELSAAHTGDDEAPGNSKRPAPTRKAGIPMVKVMSSSHRLDPLQALLRAEAESTSQYAEELVGEVTLLLNAAAVFFSVDFSETERLALLSGQVKGCCNIGLQLAMQVLETEAAETLQRVGLQKCYRLGLTALRALQSRARSIPTDTLKELAPTSPLFLSIAGLREKFPVQPDTVLEGIQDQDSTEALESVPTFGPICSLAEIQALEQLFTTLPVPL